jgi:hypothetical protein
MKLIPYYCGEVFVGSGHFRQSLNPIVNQALLLLYPPPANEQVKLRGHSSSSMSSFHPFQRDLSGREDASARAMEITID